MRIVQTWAVALTAALLATSAFAQGIDHRGFQRSTLEALDANLTTGVTADKRPVPFKVGDTIDAPLSLWVFEANYAGATRPISAEEATFIRDSFKAVQQESLAALYQQSMLFRVNGKDYWLPVESDVIPSFAKELKAGDKIDLYVMLSGGVLQKNGWDWLFLVADFQKPQSGPR